MTSTTALVEIMHGAGPPQAQKVMLLRHANIDHKKQLAKGIAGIKDTFRTDTGKIYGPEFIELGLAIGEKIYQFLLERFAEELQAEERSQETENRIQNTEKRIK